MKIRQVVILGIALLVEKWTSACLIGGQVAFCSAQSYYYIPVLPADVTEVDLSINYISEVNETSFIGLEQLRKLDLGSQRTYRLEIKAGAFRPLLNLTFLHLGDNSKLVLDPDAFVGLSQLQHLILLYNSLNQSILENDYLKPLLSLQILNLYGNKIERLRPGLFFGNMRKLRTLDLTLNDVQRICEQDLIVFQGKHFDLLKLSSNYLNDMEMFNFDWNACGNPFRNMSFGVLDLANVGFGVDRARYFLKAMEGTNITKLIFSSNTMGRSIGFNNLKDPDSQTFHSLKKSSLKSLDLSKNYIFSLEFSVFGALQETEELILSGNKINQVQRNAFLGLQNLQKLNLSYNLIGEVYVYTFDNLPNLVELDLSYNHIGVIVHNSLNGLLNLRSLNLSGNLVNALHTFAPSPTLELIYLADNKLTSTYGLSRFAQNSIIIDLEQNRLRNLNELYEILHDLPAVRFVLLGSNLLSVCNPQRSIPPNNSLIYLDLKRNVLQYVWENGFCLDVFNNLGQLSYLYLSHNLLRSIPQSIFKGLTSLQLMDLSFNLLTYLPQDVFPVSLKVLDLSYNILSSPDPLSFSFINHVDFGMNRFFCDCSMKDFLLWLNQTNTAFLSPKEMLTCEYPKDLLGVRLIDLNSDSCEEDDETLLSEIRPYIFACCFSLLMLLIISTIISIHFRGACFILYKKAISRVFDGPQNVPANDGSKYDAYLCFSNIDYKWVETALLNKLDSQFSEHNLLRCCFEERDFVPGEDYISNIRDAIWFSRKTVCIVSREFLKDGWCIEAFKLAQSRMLDELRNVLIMVLVESIPEFKLLKHKTIRTFVQKKEYLQWPENPQDIEWFYDRLIAKILKEEISKCKNSTELQTISVVGM